MQRERLSDSDLRQLGVLFYSQVCSGFHNCESHITHIVVKCQYNTTYSLIILGSFPETYLRYSSIRALLCNGVSCFVEVYSKAQYHCHADNDADRYDLKWMSVCLDHFWIHQHII